jgi:hypothetical protein
MDLELLSGLQQLGDTNGDMSGNLMGNLMGQMMGAQSFNYLAGYGGDGGGFEPQAQQQQAMLGMIAGYNPELAMMMGWNPFGAIKDAAKWVGNRATGAAGAMFNPMAHLAARALGLGGGGHPAPSPSPLAQPTPLSAVQPQMPGVPDRGGRVQPLGFENGAFTAAGPAVVTIRARPQRPLRGGRLVADFARTGTTATGLLTLVQLVVATDGQLLSGDPISFAALSPNAFGVGVNLSPAAVGNEIFATVAISALPASTDRVDFNLTLFGLTVG